MLKRGWRRAAAPSGYAGIDFLPLQPDGHGRLLHIVCVSVAIIIWYFPLFLPDETVVYTAPESLRRRLACPTFGKAELGVILRVA